MYLFISTQELYQRKKGYQLSKSKAKDLGRGETI